MKNIVISLASVGLLILSGCGSGTPGGPGAVSANSNRVVGPSENTFTLDTPMTATTMRQGENKEIKISMSRGKNFDQDVLIHFVNAPQGVTFQPISLTLPKG